MRRIALLLALLCLSCGRSGVDLDSLESPSNRSILVTGDYPAVVKVVLPQGYGMCTGTFVSPRAVLTAAHCTPSNGVYTIISSFGTFRTSVREVLGTGEPGDERDLAVLALDQDVADPRQGQVVPVGSRPELLEKVRLVGFGCESLQTRLGTGVKRTGTNQVFRLGSHVELLTPAGTTTSTRGLIGPENRAGSCFGDSGGPMLRWLDGTWEVCAASHGGGTSKDGTISAYVDLNHADNLDFLHRVDDKYELGMFDVCQTAPGTRLDCQTRGAFALFAKVFHRIISFFIDLWL